MLKFVRSCKKRHKGSVTGSRLLLPYNILYTCIMLDRIPRHTPSSWTRVCCELNVSSRLSLCSSEARRWNWCFPPFLNSFRTSRLSSDSLSHVKGKGAGPVWCVPRGGGAYVITKRKCAEACNGNCWAPKTPMCRVLYCVLRIFTDSEKINIAFNI